MKTETPKQYVLVYQAGIANVFLCENGLYEVTGRSRVTQNAFGPCEWFCRGLMEAGEAVAVAWCNKAGDITGDSWNYGCFDDAPFCEHFALAPRNV